MLTVMFGVLWEKKKKFNELIYAFQTSKNFKGDYWNLLNLQECNAKVIQLGEKFIFGSIRRKTGSMAKKTNSFVCLFF